MRYGAPDTPRRRFGTAPPGGQAAAGAAACLLLFLASSGFGADVAALGGWTRAINSSNLSGGAGTDLVGAYESGAAASTIDISNTGGLGWRVDVRRSDATWNADLVLSLRRTSEGVGGGSISGGGGYQAIGTGDATLFTGVDDRSGVSLQYRLSGVSVGVPPASYSTTVVLTVGPP